MKAYWRKIKKIVYENRKENKNDEYEKRVEQQCREITTVSYKKEQNLSKSKSEMAYQLYEEVTLRRTNGNKWRLLNDDKESEDTKRCEVREALLMNLDEESEIKLIDKVGLRGKPELIILDGVDGTGKTSVVTNLRKRFDMKGEKVRFNTFKRRREDKKKFKEIRKETEWEFRKEVVEEINRRITEYRNKEWIILDKSPYSEYFYQQTPSFDRGYISRYQNHLLEKEIFRYKDIIDNAIVIFLENDECWENYRNREENKKKQGYQTSYGMLNEESYRDMVNSFKRCQDIYNDTEKYKKIQIKNDNESWEKVYDAIRELSKKEEI